MNQPHTYFAPDTKVLEEVAGQLLKDWAGYRVFAIEGPMGAGKTTLIKALCQHLETTDNVCSPTFAIINVYQTLKEGLIYHFDLYRLKDRNELLATGALEYFDSGAWCFIEWPEAAFDLLPEDSVHIKIKVLENGGREIEVKNLEDHSHQPGQMK
ncbi:MAG: tRNA (adenosine(37)-N6)-threonylcarbamoyltransferase complex ATPase subunit type 1 TsaE [Bacteroidales bacterium]